MCTLIVWWALVTAALWLSGKATDQPPSITGCATSAAFLIAIGEAGDWARRKRRPRPS